MSCLATYRKTIFLIAFPLLYSPLFMYYDRMVSWRLMHGFHGLFFKLGRLLGSKSRLPPSADVILLDDWTDFDLCDFTHSNHCCSADGTSYGLWGCTAIHDCIGFHISCIINAVEAYSISFRLGFSSPFHRWCFPGGCNGISKPSPKDWNRCAAIDGHWSEDVSALLIKFTTQVYK